MDNNVESSLDNIIDIKKRRSFNTNYVGFCILAIILVYVLICTIIFLTKKKVTVYEVNPGSISNNSTYTGFIMRTEETVMSEFSGKLSYFVFEKERIKVGSNICCVDASGTVSEYVNSLKENKTDFEEKDITKINKLVSDFKYGYNSKNFNSIYNFKSTLNTNIDTYLNENILDDLNSYIETNPSPDYNIISSNRTGIVMYGYDGYENFDVSGLTYNHFKKEDYVYHNLTVKTDVSKDSVIYKIITEQEWDIYIKLTDEQAKKYSEKSAVKIMFTDSKITTNADFEIYNNQYGVYGKISLNRYVNDYAGERFVNIKIIDSEISGLKIPKTSVVEKDFYKLPKEYVTKGGNSNEDGVIVRRITSKKGDTTDVFISISIYDSDDENYYIDNKSFMTTDKIIMPNSSKEYSLSETKKVKGVYRVNKGYAVFRKIEILDSNNDYYIISKTTSLGLSNYDHIVYDSSTVEEDEVLY